MAVTAENTVHQTVGLAQSGKVSQRIVFAVLGLFLVVTALFKVQGAADGALGQNTILFSPRLQFAVMEAEALLGLWLLSGWAKRTAWFFALAFFLAVAGFSFYLGLMGQSSCGCFGRIHVSPWTAFALDMTCLMLLGLGWSSMRRPGRENATASGWLSEVITIISGAGAILVLGLGGVLLAGASSSTDFLALLRGERISIDPPVTDLGTDAAGTVHRFTVRLHNHTDHPITIVGGTADCACVATDELPATIAPGESVLVTMHARFKGTAGMFQQEFSFYTDDKDQDRVLARFKGSIIE